MKVIILAAGYGTRLYPHTINFPKPLLKVDKKPIISYLLDKLGGLEDLSRIVVVTNNRFFKFFRAWKDNLPQTSLFDESSAKSAKKWELEMRRKIRLLNDLSTSPEDKLGSIGDMYFALGKENFSGDFLVLGGDNLFKGGLVDFMRFAKKKEPSVTIGLFDIKDKRRARNFGVVRLNKKNRIVEFSEKPRRPKSSLVAMCLYYFPQEKIRLIGEYLSNPHNCRDTSGSYISWLSGKDRVYGYVFRDFWFDVGYRGALKKIEKALRGE